MVGVTQDQNTDEENLGIGRALEHFTELDDILALIDNIKNIYDTTEIENEYNKLCNILKLYYAQPHLLDPHLDKILSKFLTIVKDKNTPMKLKHAAFQYMHQIIRVRGYKVVVRHLPHEVADFQYVLAMLESQDPADVDTWWSRFVLLLWLSIVVMIPFHMSRLDSFTPGSDGESSKKKTVMERLLDLCKTYALTSDVCSVPCAFLTSKFLTRSDVKEIHLGPYLEWACQLNSNIKEEGTIKYGVLAAVAAVLKHGKRDDLLPYAHKLLEWLTTQNYRTHKSILVRKYGVKILQRIGLTYLKPRVASFRYTMGSRSLATTLAGAPAAGDLGAVTTMEDDDQDIPQQVEEIVELLLLWIRDEDTVVRWSAAKGVGRLGARLPPAAAADVLDCVLALFAEHERETAWHGGCMALAECARRGLLSPAQLGAAVLAIRRALRRDEARAAGAGGGGQPARDSACHAAWAIARAYDAAALAPHATELATALVATALFDREINCRRAASAAFQENVGRHGVFPRGIDVLVLADFHAVGPRAHAYLHIAPEVARFPEYTRPLIEHLVELKTEHWDVAIRELAGRALHKLTERDPEYMAKTVLPTLMDKVKSIDLNVRHGSIIAIGEIVHALSLIKLPDGGTAYALVPDGTEAWLRGLVASLYARQLYRGLGGELMRQATCHCIAGLARAHLPCHGHRVIDEWLELIEECLSHEVAAIRDKALAALPLVFEEYLRDGVQYDGVGSADKRRALLERYCAQLGSTGAGGQLLRMGYAKAIGSLPKFVLVEHIEMVVAALRQCTRVTEHTAKWAESRRDAVAGLAGACRAVGVPGAAALLPAVFDTLLECVDEYTLDNRGDIGAWVREAAMAGLLSLCRQCAAEQPALNTDDTVRRVMCQLAQKSVEKIDRTRALAGKTFTAMLYNEPPIRNIPHLEALQRIFPRELLAPRSTGVTADGAADGAAADGVAEQRLSENSSAVAWLFPGDTMPRFVPLLDFDVYRYQLVKGLLVSAGDLSESLVKHTTESLYSYLGSADPERLRKFSEAVTEVFTDNQHVARITGPIFNFLDGLFASGCLSPILQDKQSTFAMDILKLVLSEIRGCRNIYKLLDAVNVLCQLTQVGGEVCSKALVQLSIVVCHGDRYVRRTSATRLYEALVLYADDTVIPAHNADKVMALLADTDWERDVEELRPIRNELCDLMGVRRPVPRANVKPA